MQKGIIVFIEGCLPDPELPDPERVRSAPHRELSCIQPGHNENMAKIVKRIIVLMIFNATSDTTMHLGTTSQKTIFILLKLLMFVFLKRRVDLHAVSETCRLRDY